MGGLGTALGDYGTSGFVANLGRFVRGWAAIFRKIVPFCSICSALPYRVRRLRLVTPLIMRTDVLFVKGWCGCGTLSNFARMIEFLRERPL